MFDEIMEDSAYEKRKKKRSFFQKQRQFAKRGSFGNGTELTQDTYEYFINIIKLFKAKKDVHEKGILSSNALHEMEGKEAEYCCNQMVSRVVEQLLPYSFDEPFLNFITNFSANLRPLFSDSFGSHVLRQTLIVAYNKYRRLFSEEDNKLRIKFYEYILKVSNFLYNNIEDFISGTHSNPVGRTVLNVLSGNPTKEEIKLNLDTCFEGEVTTSLEFNNIIRNFVKKIISWPHFIDLCNEPINSVFLQILLVASKNFNECSQLVDKIIGVCERVNLDLKADKSIPIVRLLEVVVFVSNEKTYEKLYKLVFENKLIELGVSKNGNFAVQRLVSSCKSEKIFLKLFAELEKHMADIVEAEKFWILVAVVKKCRQLEVNQKECLEMLMKVFKIKDTRDLFVALCSLTCAEKVRDLKCTLHGCLIVQEVLQFKKPMLIVNSLLELPQNILISVLCDVRGSHIMDAFIKSSTVGEYSRDNLFERLQGKLHKLVTSKHGSRSLDALWSVISLNQKVLVADELKEHENEIYKNFFGKFFVQKINLREFRRNKKKWINLQKQSVSAVKLFSHITPEMKRRKLLT